MSIIMQDIYDIVEMIARIADCPVEKILEIAKSNGLTQ